MRCNGYLYGRLVFRQIDHACGVNDMDGSCEIRSDSMVLFFLSLSLFDFFPLFSLRRCCVAFLMIVLSKVEMVVGLNGKWGFEWVIWRYRVLVFEWNMKKICRNGFFFVLTCCCACDIFFYLWIWFIATRNISLQLVIISISQRCRKFTTFYLIKFVI